MGASPSSPVPAAEAALFAARAAAETTRAAAETTRALADAAATKARSDAEITQMYASLVPLAIGLAVVGALAVDFALCESPALIRRRMLRTLRACRLPPSVPAARAPLLPLPQVPLVLGPLPAMLLGPTGCGKSTLLAELARATVAAPKPAPVVLVRLRLPSREHGGADDEVKSGKVLMDMAAAQFYAQIGYPPRRSLLGSFFARGIHVPGLFQPG